LNAVTQRRSAPQAGSKIRCNQTTASILAIPTGNHNFRYRLISCNHFILFEVDHHSQHSW